MNSTEEKLIRIQKSTRTTMPFFVPLHNLLRMRLKWYYNWHLWRNSSRAHLAVLFAMTIGIAVGMYSTIANVARPDGISASGESWIASGAGDVTYNQTYAYAGTHNGADYYVFGSGASTRYLFKATNPVGTITWRLNDSLQADATAPATADYWTVSNTLPGTSWNVDPTKPEISPAPGLTSTSSDGTLAGVIYTDDTLATTVGAGKTVALSIDGGAKITAETYTDGQFVFSGQTYGVGSIISIFLDDETEKASNVFTSPGPGAIAALVLVVDHIKLGSSSSGNITNTILDTADNVGDVDLGISVSGGVATFANGKKLWVRVDKTYIPGGSVICHDLRVNGTLTMASNALTISGSLSTAGAANGLITTSTTVTFVSTSVETINVTGSNFRAIDFNGVGGEWTISGSLRAGYIHPKHGTILGTADVVVDSGDVSSSAGEDGVVNMSGGTFTVYSEGIVANQVPWTFYNLILGNGTDGRVTGKQTSNDLTINGSLTITANHVLSVSSGNIYLKGNFVNNGTLTPGASTFILSGAGQQNIAAATFNSLTVQNASANGVVFDGNITTNATLTDVTPSSKITFNSGSTYAFNAINLNGNATTTRIILTSSSSGSPWDINITAASPSASYVDVKDSVANKEINALTGGKDSGGNTLWLFSATKTVSGTVYSDNNKTGNIGLNKTIALSVDGGAPITAETDVNGFYSFSNVEIPQNSILAMYISGETEKGSIIIHTGTVDTTYVDMEWYAGNVKPSFRLGTDITEITNLELDVADNVGDTDLGVSVTNNVATFADNLIMYVWTNKTYRPGGAVVADNVEIDGTLNAESNIITASGNFTVTGSFIYGTSTVSLIGSGVITVPATSNHDPNFYNLSMASASQATEMLSEIKIANVLTLGTGSLTGDTVANIWFLRNDGSSPLVNSGATIDINRFFFSPSSGSTTVPGGNYGSVEYIELYSRGPNVTYNVSGNITVNGIFFIVGYNTTSGMVVNTNNHTINAVGMIWGYNNAYGNTTTNFGSSVINLGSYGIAPLPAPGGSHVVNFNSATLNVGGSFDLFGVTPNFGTSVLNMTATSSGKNIKTYGHNLSNGIIFNGVGGEWTLQDDLSTSGLTVTKGKLIDNGKNVNVGGNISIAVAEGSLVSTGVWTMTASGDIQNGGYNATFPPSDYNNVLVYNSIYDFRLADGVTAHRIYYLNVRKLTMGSNSAITSNSASWYLRVWLPFQDNFLSFSGNYAISGAGTVFYTDRNDIKRQGEITLGENLLVGYQDKGTLILTGHWNISGSLDVSGNYYSTDESTAAVLDTNGYNLNISGNVKVGHSNRNAENKWAGKIKFASGTHRIAGSLYTPGINTIPINGQVGGYTHGYYDFGSSTIYVGSNVQFNQYASAVGANTSTIVLNGSAAQSLSSVLPLYNLVLQNSSSNGVSLLEDLVINGTFTNTIGASKVIFGSGKYYSFNAINIDGGSTASRITLASSSPGNQWNFILGDTSPTVSYINVTDSNATDGMQIKANDGTSLDGGNNLNWLFGNYNTEIVRVSIAPSVININPGKSYHFQAKAYNSLGAEVTGAVIWMAKPESGSISSSGLFTAGNTAGNYSDAITATMGEKSASVDVNIVEEEPYIIPGWIIISPDSKVLKPREEYKFAGKIYDTTGLLIENASPEWRLVDGGGEITTDGLFVAGEKEGTFINSIVASYADVRSYATVVIQSDKPIIVKKETIISQIINTGKAVLETAKSIAKNDPVRETALVVTAVATASAGVSGMLGLVSAQMGIKEYLLFIINYFLSLRAAKRKNKFGIVFDESTQRPVQGAMVRLFDFKTMRLVSTAITDKNGSYIFIVQPGEYVMSVVKPGFAFPSNMIRISQNLVDNYIGQTIVVDNDHPVINQKIPIDPSSNQQIRLGLVFRLLNSIYFRPIVLILGSIMTVYALFLVPSTLNFIVAGGFVLLWLAEVLIQNRNVKFSKVLDRATGKPVSLALVRVLSPEKKLLETFISDQYGRVLPKVKNIGDSVIIEKAGYDKIIETVNNQGLVEKKKFNLIKGDCGPKENE